MQEVTAFAEEVGLHTGIVVGMLSSVASFRRVRSS